MGVDFLAKRKHRIEHLGDLAKQRLAKAGLWTALPHVLAADFPMCGPPGAVAVGDEGLAELVGDRVRVTVGHREVGEMETTPAFREALRERDSCVKVVVREITDWGDSKLRVRDGGDK